MTRREVEKKFDEIVRFAEIEKFIDTPVKRYSSGMYVRLAFAVAAHLEPEILLVDEVLAVGDASFQKKCLGKMGDVAKEGRTVLFVSHNIGVIKQICQKIIFIKDGQLVNYGSSNEIISQYLASLDTGNISNKGVYPEDEIKEAQLIQVSIINNNGIPAESFTCDDSISIHFTFIVRKELSDLYGALAITNRYGDIILHSDSYDTPPNLFGQLNVGMHEIEIIIHPRSLGVGNYQVTLNFTSRHAHTWNVDSPGIIGKFSLFDFSTKRGNDRLGYLSTLPIWRVIN
jgi:lipopolysaccharide transport system ATP-binding protein